MEKLKHTESKCNFKVGDSFQYDERCVTIKSFYKCYDFNSCTHFHTRRCTGYRLVGVDESLWHDIMADFRVREAE